MHKRILSFAFSTVFALGVAMAAPQDQPAPQDQAGPPPQGGPRGGGRGMMDPDRQIQMMTKQLHLSDDQVTQIKPILADHMSQMMALRGDTTLAQEDKMAKMKGIREDGNTKVMAILTPDQQAKFTKMQAEQRSRMMQQRQQQAPPDGSNQ